MDASQKLIVVGRLAVIGEDNKAIESDVIELIAKIVHRPVQQPSPDYIPQPVSPTLDELHMATRCGKIAAIKEYRARTKAGLKESKDKIEQGLSFLGWEGYGTQPSYEYKMMFVPAEEMPF